MPDHLKLGQRAGWLGDRARRLISVDQHLQPFGVQRGELLA